MKLVEMVPNFSDGRNRDTIILLENAIKETPLYILISIFSAAIFISRYASSVAFSSVTTMVITSRLEGELHRLSEAGMGALHM